MREFPGNFREFLAFWLNGCGKKPADLTGARVGVGSPEGRAGQMPPVFSVDVAPGLVMLPKLDVVKVWGCGRDVVQEDRPQDATGGEILLRRKNDRKSTIADPFLRSFVLGVQSVCGCMNHKPPPVSGSPIPVLDVFTLENEISPWLTDGKSGNHQAIPGEGVESG